MDVEQVVHMDEAATGVRAVPVGGSGRFGLLDHCLCWCLAFLAMAWAYHPYFFGDEISPLLDARNSDGFLETLRVISQYKPRLIFNAVWAFGGEAGWPRWAYAAVNAAAMAATCSLAAMLVDRHAAASRLQAWLLVGCIVASRFAAMLYFDYVSGIIETLSIALLLGVIALSMDAVSSGRLSAWIGAVVLAIAMVLVHERFMAGTAALAVVLALQVGVFDRRQRPWWTWPMIGLLAALPPLVFLVLIELMESLPASTGTSGSAVIIGAHTPVIFLSYVANAFFGMNFGKQWFVGRLNMGQPAGWWLSVGYAIAFAGAWIAWLASVRRDRRAVGFALGLLTMAGGMLVMASLPGEGRQEARWVFPVGVLVGMLYFASPSGRVRITLLSLSLSLSLVHWGSGALSTTANLYESRTARNLATGVNHIVPMGRHALLMRMGEGVEAVWAVGEYEGVDEFARLNFRVPLTLEIHRQDVPVGNVDMGLLRTGTDDDGAAVFSQLRGRDFQVMLDPASIDAWRGSMEDAGTLGEGRSWAGWKWSSEPQHEGDALLLRPLAEFDGFVERPAATLAGRVLVYRARSRDSAVPSRMRLQVNWMDGAGHFVDASILVVEVGASAQDHVMPLLPPAAAATGLVYASLHDGERQPVLLESVKVRAKSMETLGAGAAWPGWRWAGAVSHVPEGVILPGEPPASGLVAVPARRLDNRILVYRARAARQGTTPTMRLQVNWSDAQGSFLGASIETVQVGDTAANYPMLVQAPVRAESGEVYASLHDGETNGVLFESVDLLNRQ
jgi:hypothetical protein